MGFISRLIVITLIEKKNVQKYLYQAYIYIRQKTKFFNFSYFYKKVKIFNNLNHPNILKFYNWYETRNHLWIIFEYCAGSDLM